jgi:thioredoxin 1
MKLRSKYLGGLAIWAVLTLIFLSLGVVVWAQDKATKAKTTKEQSAPKPSVFKPRVTFVEIGAASCIPCKMMQPIMKAVAEEYKGQVKVVFHDVWTKTGRQDAEKYKIRVIPTQVFLDIDGREYFRHEGFFPKEELVKVLKMQGVK